MFAVIEEEAKFQLRSTEMLGRREEASGSAEKHPSGISAMQYIRST